LQPNGNITGAASQNGTRNLVLRATDTADNQFAEVPLSIRVLGLPTVGSITAPVGNRGMPLVQALSASSILGNASWSIQGTLPAGLALDNATGRISGILTSGAVGASQLRATVTDDFDGKTGSALFDIWVNSYPAADAIGATAINGYANNGTRTFSNGTDASTGYLNAARTPVAFGASSNVTASRFADYSFPTTVAAGKLTLDGVSTVPISVTVSGLLNGAWVTSSSYQLAPGETTITFNRPIYGTLLRANIGDARTNVTRIKFSGN
jgi:hypothetical protein